MGAKMADPQTTKAEVAEEIMAWMKWAVRDASYKAPEQMTPEFVDARYFSAMRDHIKAYDEAAS